MSGDLSFYPPPLSGPFMKETPMTKFRTATALAATVASITLSTPAAAYPVDCAILLCLAGGWPASAECSHARAVFIARITPWPVEPPLQIWNCPMRAAYREEASPMDRLFEIAWSAPPVSPMSTVPSGVVAGFPEAIPAADRADIDIGGPAFDFVRSIRVWHVEYRHLENRHGDCIETDRTLSGFYGDQGEYRWRPGTAHAAPGWMGVDLACKKKGGMFRAVGVEWRDQQGKAGHEVVRY